MSHSIYRIIGFARVGSHTLRVQFDDGTEQVVSFRTLLEGALYGPLQDETVFNQVVLDPEVHTLVWPNGAAFDPETLHDWPKYAEEMKRMTSQWTQVGAKVA